MPFIITILDYICRICLFTWVMIKIIIHPKRTRKMYAEFWIVSNYSIIAAIGLNSLLHCWPTSLHSSHTVYAVRKLPFDGLLSNHFSLFSLRQNWKMDSCPVHCLCLFLHLCVCVCVLGLCVLAHVCKCVCVCVFVCVDECVCVCWICVCCVCVFVCLFAHVCVLVCLVCVGLVCVCVVGLRLNKSYIL